VLSPSDTNKGASSLYYLTATLSSAAVSVANTYIPLYLRSLGASYFLSGLPLVVRGIGRFSFDASSIYVMGALRPQMVLSCGIALGALAMLECGIFPSAYPVIAACFFVGVGLAMLHISLRQIVFEGARKGRRGHAIGLLSVFISTGPMLGIALGGFISEYFGYRSLFLTSGSLILWLPFVLVYRTKSEVLATNDEDRSSTLRFQVVWEILRTPGAPLLCSCSFYSLFYQQARSLAVAFYATDFIGLSLASYGLMRSISQLGNMSGRYFGGSWTDRSGVANCLAVGFIVSSMGYAMVSWSTGFWSLMLVHTAIGIGAGMVNVGSQVAIMSIVPSPLRGQAIGLYRAVGDVGMLIGPVIITSSLESYGFTGSFAWMAVLPLLFAAMAVLNRGRLGVLTMNRVES
jgi:MFS family permease